MHEDPEKTRRDGRIPDELWERIVPLLPPRKPHPLGCHRPRVEDRKAMEAIFFVLRSAASGTRCMRRASAPASAAYRRFQEWTEAGVPSAVEERPDGIRCLEGD
jgi:transposase